MALQLATADVREHSFEAAEMVHAVATPSRTPEGDAKELAALAEYLAVELHGHPGQIAAAAEVLDEWADGNSAVLARARAEAREDTNLDTLHAEVLALLQPEPTTRHVSDADGERV